MKKALSTVLAALLVLSVLPLSAFAAVDYDETVGDGYYNVISKDDYELAPGITESEIVLNNDSGSHRQVAHVVEIDIHNPFTKVMPSYRGMVDGLNSKNYGVEVMSKQAAYAEANGYGNVVAAMNLSLSWYDSAYYDAHPELVGEPLGYIVLDGVQYTNSQGQTAGAKTCLVINFDEKDGVARPADIPKTEIRSTASAITGWEEQVIPANFEFLVKDGKNQYSANHTSGFEPRSFVGVKADGTIVMVMNDGRQSPYSSGFNNYEMAEFMLSLGCVYATNGDGGGSSAFLTQRPGEELELHCMPSDGAERETTHGILVISTAPATGEFVRASISSAEDYYTPGSTVPFTAIGSDLVGTAAQIPAEATWQLADSSFGTMENGVFVSNGKTGDVVVQMVYDGKVVGEDTIHIVMPDTLVFAQANMVVPYGKTVDLGLTATYNNRKVALKASDVTFTLSKAGIGTINGFDFTAAEEGATDTAAVLTAVVGEASATTNMSLGRGSVIVYNFEDQDLTGWDIEDNYGKYGPVGPNGKVTDDNGNYWYNGQNELGEIRIVDSSSGQVRNGQYALAVECDYTQIYETGYHALNLLFPQIDTTDAIAVGFWLYVPYDARHAEISIAGGGIGNGELFKLCEGWHYVTAVPNEANTWRHINISVDDRACANTGNYYDYITEGNVNGKFTFYIDDITLDYSTAVEDREVPVFGTPMVQNATGESTAALTGQTVNYNTLTFEAKVSENTDNNNYVGLDGDSARVYVDGKEVDCTFAGGKIVAPSVTLADGIHTVKFAISDKNGNSAWVAGDILVDAGTDASTVMVVPQNPQADRLLIGSLYWMDVVATDMQTIDKVEMTFDLNNGSSWELEGMTVAEGFTAAYSIREDDNIAYITITRTGENTTTGEGVLASFPVRTWVSTITECEGYENQTPTTLVSRGIIWKKCVELELQQGIITFVEGTAPNTTGSFGMEDLLVETEIFFTNYSRKSVAGAEAQIAAWKVAKTGWHEHTVTELDDKAATCTADGYTGRTYCGVCESVVSWGTKVPATGHKYALVDGVMECVNGCGKLFTGELDGKIYTDGVLANGWVGDTYYCVNGVKVTGNQILDRTVHYFDENGKYDPIKTYSGLIYWGTDLYYAVNNKFVSGWQYVDGDYYYFSSTNQKAVNGERAVGGYNYRFEDYKLVEGQWAKSSDGDHLKYMWAGRWCRNQWITVNGVSYCFDGKSYAYVGVQKPTNHTKYYVFDETGAWLENYNGEYTWNGKDYYVIDGIAVNGLVEIDGYYYYVRSNGKFATGKYYTTTTNGLLPADYYTFAADGRMLNPPGSELIEDGIHKNEDGVLCYYKDGVPCAAGLIVIDGNYYYARTGGVLAIGQYWTTNTNGLMEAKLYTFDETGKMVIEGGEETDKTGVYQNEEGVWYYYKNGQPFAAGLIVIDGNYYYARTGGVLAIGQYWTTNTNGLMEAKLYTFDETGKMVMEGSGETDKTGVYQNEEGVWYYYKNGQPFAAGLIVIDGNYYYARTGGVLAIGQYWTTNTNGLLPAARYEFDETGKMLNPPVQDEA